MTPIRPTTSCQPSLKVRRVVAFFGSTKPAWHETEPYAAIALGESPGDYRIDPRAVLRIALMPPRHKLP